MTQNCKPSAILPFDQSADHSSVPAKFRTAVPQISGRGGRSASRLTARGTCAALTRVDARPIGPYTAVKQPVRAPCPRDQIAMIEIVLHRSLSQDIASSDVRQEEQGDISLGWRDKSADCRRAFLVGREGVTEHRMKSPAGAFAQMSMKSISPEPSLVPSHWRAIVNPARQ